VSTGKKAHKPANSGPNLARVMLSAHVRKPPRAGPKTLDEAVPTGNYALTTLAATITHFPRCESCESSSAEARECQTGGLRRCHWMARCPDEGRRRMGRKITIITSRLLKTHRRQAGGFFLARPGPMVSRSDPTTSMNECHEH